LLLGDLGIEQIPDEALRFVLAFDGHPYIWSSSNGTRSRAADVTSF
jgi:hypothetical protein